jgi:hypothetical protein
MIMYAYGVEREGREGGERSIEESRDCHDANSQIITAESEDRPSILRVSSTTPHRENVPLRLKFWHRKLWSRG